MKVRTTITTVLLLLLCTSVFADDVPTGNLFSGDAKRVWLVRPTSDGKSCDVFIKELGVAWQTAVRNQSSVPTTAVAAEDSLHLFYPQRQHIFIDTSGEMQVVANLPGDLTAGCSGENFGGADKDSPTVFILVQQDQPPTPSADTQPTTAAALPATTMSHTPCECIYRTSGYEWSPVAWCTLPAKRESSDPVFLIVFQGKMYRLDQRQGDAPNRPFVLRVLSLTPGRQMKWTDIHTFPADQTPLGMVALKDRICIVIAEKTGAATKATTTPATTPATISLSITRFNPAGKPPMSTQPITRDTSSAHWPADAPPNVTRLGEQLALLWQDGETTNFALSSPSGTLGVTENVTQAIESMPDMEWTNDLVNYFLFGVVIIIGVGMFYRRLRTPPQPFILATGLAPGNLFKRLLAGLIDFLPFNFLAGGIFLPTNISMQTAQQFLEAPATIPPTLRVAMVYALLLSLVLWVLYGTIMDMRFGATLGKRLLRLRVVKEDGAKPGLREAVLRNTTKIIELSMIQSPMGWLLAIFVLLPLLTRNRQRLGDMIARTAVVEAASLEAFQKAKSDNPPTNAENETSVKKEDE